MAMSRSFWGLGAALTSAAMAAAACAGEPDERTVTETVTATATVNATVTATATATVTATPSLSDGAFTLANAGLVQDECELGGSFWAAYSSGIVSVVASDRFELDLGDYLGDYAIEGTSLRDSASPGVFAIACNVSNGDGTFNCVNDQSYEAALAGNYEYGGIITATDEFTVEDRYEFACDGADCDTLATDVGIVAFPCLTIDAGDFSKQ